MCIHPICFQWQQSEIVWANLFAIMHQARDLAKQTQDCQLRWAIRIQSYKTYWVSQEAAHLWYDPLHFNPQFHTANICNWSAIFTCVTCPIALHLLKLQLRIGLRALQNWLLVYIFHNPCFAGSCSATGHVTHVRITKKYTSWVGSAHPIDYLLGILQTMSIMIQISIINDLDLIHLERKEVIKRSLSI